MNKLYPEHPLCRLFQLKQVETVMLALLKVAPRTTASAICHQAAGGGAATAAPPADGGVYDPPAPRSILKPRRRWSPAGGDDGSGGGGSAASLENSQLSVSAGSLAASDVETEEEPHTDVSLITEPEPAPQLLRPAAGDDPGEEFLPLAALPCDSSASPGQACEL